MVFCILSTMWGNNTSIGLTWMFCRSSLIPERDNSRNTGRKNWGFYRKKKYSFSKRHFSSTKNRNFVLKYSRSKCVRFLKLIWLDSFVFKKKVILLTIAHRFEEIEWLIPSFFMQTHVLSSGWDPKQRTKAGRLRHCLKSQEIWKMVFQRPIAHHRARYMQVTHCNCKSSVIIIKAQCCTVMSRTFLGKRCALG